MSSLLRNLQPERLPFRSVPDTYTSAQREKMANFSRCLSASYSEIRLTLKASAYIMKRIPFKYFKILESSSTQCHGLIDIAGFIKCHMTWVDIPLRKQAIATPYITLEY
jgi:hypothetical protein